MNLVFSGRIGSGKTQVSKAVAAGLGFRWNSFGATLRTIAAERGLPTTREDLQAFGESMVMTEPDELCRRVVMEAKPHGSGPLVIDGLRHRHILDILSRLLRPRRLKLIYVDAPDALRLERLRIRDGLTDEEMRKLEEHSTEIQVASEIRALADKIAVNSTTVDECVSKIVGRI